MDDATYKQMILAMTAATLDLTSKILDVATANLQANTKAYEATQKHNALLDELLQKGGAEDAYRKIHRSLG